MARLNPSPIRMYRGTTAQHSAYAGPIGELTVDTDKKTVVVQTGANGGNPVALESRQILAGDGIKVNSGASGTLASDLTLTMDQTWLNNSITDKVKGDATLITGGAGIDTTLTDTGTQVSVNEEWLAQQVTDKVKEDTSLVTAGNGVEVTPTGTGVQVEVVGSDSVVSDGTGVKVNETWLANQITDKVKEDTTLVTADDSINVTPTGTGVQVAVDETWLNEQVSNRVESGGLVTAGDGIDVTASEGKAEIAVDDTVVRTSGNQTINGNKSFVAITTFASDIFRDARHRGDGSADYIALSNADVVKGTTPTTSSMSRFMFLDGTASAAGVPDSKKLGSIDLIYTTENTTVAKLVVFQPVADSTSNATLSVVYPASGEPYTVAPPTRDTPNNTELVTVGYLKGANSGVAHLDGNETFTGKKTFSVNDIIISQTQAQNPDLLISWSDYHRGDKPAASYNMAIQFVDDRAGITGKLGTLIYRNTAENVSSTSITAVKSSDDTGAETSLSVVYPATGNPYATAPSTRETPADNEIITHDYFASHMGVLANKVPGTWYQRDALMTTNKTSVTIPANTQVAIDGKFFYNPDPVTLQTTGVASAGTDIYVYAVDNSGQLGFVLSANSTVPSGYNATNSRKIGGMHCLCADVGTIEGHPLSGYVAGDILPASVWDLKHRPVSESEGMVYHAGRGIWLDIYLSSWDGSQLVSSYGTAVADGYSAEPFHAEKFSEKFGEIGKRNMWRHEFLSAAKGSNECTQISTGADPGTSGGHVDTAGRRMISNIGLEDCAGAMWQWTEDMLEGGSYGSWPSNHNQYYLSGYSWIMSGKYSPVKNPAVDGDGVSYGDARGLPRRVLVGGCWVDGSHCGSRCVSCRHFPANRFSDVGSRGASEPRVGG